MTEINEKDSTSEDLENNQDKDTLTDTSFLELNVSSTGQDLDAPDQSSEETELQDDSIDELGMSDEEIEGVKDIEDSEDNSKVMQIVPNIASIPENFRPKPDNENKIDPKSEKLKAIIVEYIKKKKDWKYKINTEFDDDFELAKEFCTKIVPIYNYTIIKLNLSHELEISIELQNNLLKVKNIKKIVEYYNKFNSPFGNSLVKYKLIRFINEDRDIIVNLILSLYALTREQLKPVKQQDVGLPEQEFEEVTNS